MEPTCPQIGNTLTMERGRRRISIERLGEHEWCIETTNKHTEETLKVDRFTGDEWKAGRLYERELAECEIAARGEARRW